MKRRYIVKLAVRNIIGHRLRSFLTISGVAIGVGFIVFLVSLGYGLQRISTQEIANLEALQILDITPGKSKIVKINYESLEKIKNIGEVSGVAPQAELVGILGMNTSSIEGVIYGRGLDYLNLEEVNLEVGRIYPADENNEAIINKTAAKQLGYEDFGRVLGKSITLSANMSPDLLDTEEDSNTIKESFTVVGVISNDDSPYIYIPLNLLEKEGVRNYSSAKIRVDSKENVQSAKQRLENLGFKVVALKDTVDQINQFFSMFQIILVAFGSIAVLIAAIGMFNTLTISLLEKTKEISFMKILGTTSHDIWKLFIIEALIIGALGGIIGIMAGLIFGHGLNQFIYTLAQSTGNKAVQIFYAPMIFVFVTFAITLVISFLTGIYPSRRASKIDPLEAMRYE